MSYAHGYRYVYVMNHRTDYNNIVDFMTIFGLKLTIIWISTKNNLGNSLKKKKM